MIHLSTYRKALFAFALTTLALAAARAGADTLFAPYQHFPQPAGGAFVVSGTGLPDGRLLVWDGSTVYTQFSPGADRFDRLAQGYAGDTAFVALAPNGHTALLGQGYAGDLYLLNTSAPADYSPAAVVANIPGHFSGVYLNDHLVLLDVGRLDFSGSELQIVDLDAAKAGAKAAPLTVIAKDTRYRQGQALDGAKSAGLVVDKPPFAYSSSLAVDTAHGLVYAMDANTRELRSFTVAALINAFTNATPLDWATDGTLVGSVGQFFSGGVAGIQPNGHLVIGGSAGFTLPGGIQLVDPSLGNPGAASVVDTLDPTGLQDYYYVVYNAYTDNITGITFSGTAYAPQDTFTPVPALGSAGLALLIGLAAQTGRRRLHAR